MQDQWLSCRRLWLLPCLRHPHQGQNADHDGRAAFTAPSHPHQGNPSFPIRSDQASAPSMVFNTRLTIYREGTKNATLEREPPHHQFYRRERRKRREEQRVEFTNGNKNRFEDGFLSICLTKHVCAVSSDVIDPPRMTRIIVWLRFAISAFGLGVPHPGLDRMAPGSSI